MTTGRAAAGLVVAFVLLTSSPAVLGQPAARVPRVGVLAAGRADDALARSSREAFELGLRERGWKPGVDVVVDYRHGDGSPARLQELANELVRSKVDVIVGRGSPSVVAARRVTQTIPIVMSAGTNVVERGLIASLGRPGGNITGLELLARELETKQLELLKESAPALAHVAVLTAPTTELGEAAARHSRRFQQVAQGLGLQLSVFEVKQPADISEAFRAMAQARVGGILVRADPGLIDVQRHEIVALVAKQRLPAIYLLRLFIEAGGLMSYGPDLVDLHRRSAAYVDRILKGALAGELPVEQPTKFEFIVNVKAAQTLGLVLPHRLLLRATEIRE